MRLGSLSHYLQGFFYIPGGCLGYVPSTVFGRFGSLSHSLQSSIYVRRLLGSSEQSTVAMDRVLC